MHRNIDAVTHSIQFMANVAWILYRTGHLYADPDPSGAMSVGGRSDERIGGDEQAGSKSFHLTDVERP